MIKFLIHPVARLAILLAVLAGMVLGLEQTTDLKSRISNLVFEAYIEFKPRESSDKMIFVDIDDESLTKVGQWPWPRVKLAELVTNIKAAGAEVIIFDGVIAEDDRTSPSQIAALLPEDHPAQSALETLPDNDQIFAAAIKEAGNFVAGFSHGSNTEPPIIKRRILVKPDVKRAILTQQQDGTAYFETSAQFLTDLQKAAAGNGSFMASLDDDAVIRKTGLFFHDGEQLYPSLILEGVRLMEENRKDFIKIARNPNYQNDLFDEPFVASIGNYKIPMNLSSKMWVYFRHMKRDEQVPAHLFINPQESLPDLAGKVVFIASEAEGLKDLRATPIGNVAGVKVHMNAFEQILQNNFLTRPNIAISMEFFAAITVSLLLIILSFFVNPFWLLLLSAASIGGGFVASWYSFDVYGRLFDPVTPSVIVIVTFIAASILSFLKTELEKRQVRDAFGLYISPDFMRELTDDPDKLKLGGEIKDLTIMFTDIRSFTTISEGLTPEELIQLMNDFLTPMSDLVMQNRGTIDKYMGDAMMAFWNAPLDDPEHAMNACRAALGMQKALDPLNEEVAKKAKEIGKEPVLLQAGIGINTGQSAVGNMGSRQRFAYSTLGDPVNLASRLEGQTKSYGVGILIGEETAKAVPDFAVLEMDLIQVKGKTIPVHIYALLGDEELSQTEAFKVQSEKHAEMIKTYRDGKFKDALKSAKACKKLDSLNLAKAYDLYIERCEALIKNSPESWDGVFIATSK